MAGDVDPRWLVPDEYSFDVLDPTRPILAFGRRPGDWPELSLISFRRLEDCFGRDEPTWARQVAWQLRSRDATRAAETLRRASRARSATRADAVLLAHAWAILGDHEAQFDAFRSIWRAEDLRPNDPLRFEIGLSLAAHLATTQPVKSLEMLRHIDPLAPRVPAEERALRHLVAAVAHAPTDQATSGREIAAACELLDQADDAMGLAEAALAEYRRELASRKRTGALVQYLEHAMYRYETCSRFEWAAVVALQALVPLRMSREGWSAHVEEALGRAADFGTRARSWWTMDSMRRVAARLGRSTVEDNGAWSFPPSQFASPGSDR